MINKNSRSMLVCILSLLLLFIQTGTSVAQQIPITSGITSKQSGTLLSDTTLSGLKSEETPDIGYGSLKTREVTNSVTTVKSKDFNNGNINNPLQLIQGRVAGLSINKAGGDPNGTFEVRLRGLNTLTSNLVPLVVINGVIAGSMDNIDPNDIESITILKDGAAQAIYGMRGSEGVILINTKRGKSGKSVIDYNVYASTEMVAKNTPMMNATEWRTMANEVGFGSDFHNSTNWFKEIEQTAVSQVHSLSLSGGTEKTSYRASINYRAGDGVLIKTGYNQLNGRINIVQKALKDRLAMDFNMAATERESNYGFAAAFRYAATYNPTAPVKSPDPSYVRYDGYFQQIIWDSYNPVQIAREDINEGKTRNLNISLKGTYEIIKGLSIDALYSRENSGILDGIYYNSHDLWGGMNRMGLASRKQDNSAMSLFESSAHFNRELTSTLKLSMLGGYSYNEFTNEGFYAQGGTFLTDDFTFNNLAAALDFNNGKGTISSYKNSNKLAALFGRASLNLNNFWYVSGSLTYEGSSKLSSANKWGYFPSLGTAVDLSSLMNGNFFNRLKIRASWGKTGNLPSENYLSMTILGPQGIFYYNGDYIPSYTPQSSANTGLKWEKTGEFDMGFDFTVLKSKLSGSFDLFSRTSSDLIYDFYIPTSPNPNSSASLNIGKMKSSGLEVTLNYDLLKRPDLSYTISFNSSFNLKNSLVSLSGDYNGTHLAYGTQDLSDMGSPGNGQTALVRLQEGKPVGQLIAYKYGGIDKNGYFIFEDINHDGKIDYYDIGVAGNGLPKSLFGIGNTITFRNWDLNVFFRAVLGHDLVNSYREFYEISSYINTYNLLKSTAGIRNSNGQLLRVSSGILSDFYIENASFISLDNFCLGYNFRLSEKSQFNKVRVYLAGNNLFYVTGYKGSDPNPRYGDSEFTEYNPLVPGVDRRNTWPRTRSITIGANIIF